MDKKALKTLFSCHWGPQGWHPERDRAPDPEDFAHAKKHGVMFDPVHMDHDKVVSDAISTAAKIESRAVADAFTCSLLSRDLAYRSALGSYATLQHLPAHTMKPSQRQCDICGIFKSQPEDREDLNVLNFERMKWGGVRHEHPIYALFDLQLFSSLPVVRPSDDDVSLLKELLAAIENAPSDTSAATLHASFPKTLRSNKAERDVVIAILGLCGILETVAHRGFSESFVPVHSRGFPGRRFVDMAYPACWWTSADGINTAAVHRWFGHLL